jgi:hypothetical protein
MWLVLCLMVLLDGCDWLPFGYTTIKEITAAPENFESKEVKIRGKVSSVIKLPLFDVKAYRLRDDTGEINVGTLGDVPAVNDQLTLRGTVKSTAMFNGHSLDLRVEEIRRF